MMGKYVYYFGSGQTEGKADMKNLLGGKGANLAEMANLNVPVPPGFTITTESSVEYYGHGETLWDELKNEVMGNLEKLEKSMGIKFGDNNNPLLVSVRSGARVSMPGMMDTILNLGLNDDAVKGMADITSNPRLAYDSYRRFIQMFSDVAMGVDGSLFEHALESIKKKNGYKIDTELTVEDLKKLVEEYKAIYKKEQGQEFPQDPMEQLWAAIEAVFKSWNTKRAVHYRKLHGIPDTWGTAVNVQAMVFGNMGDDSATGVCFTRDPATGENVFFGEYLINAQGEDVVAGIRTPQPINKSKKKNENEISLEEAMPKAYAQLVEIYKRLEKHYRDMQDLEFTIQKGTLFMLQTRTGKRTAQAAVKIAVDMVDEGLISKEEAVLRVAPDQLDQLLHPMIDPDAEMNVIAAGLPASPGAAVGKVVFDAEHAFEEAEKGEDVILVRMETSPEDIKGMAAANGILTVRGGMTSHAAVVARGMGKCCVSGAEAINLSYQKKAFEVNGTTVKEGEWITLNGSTGEVMLGKVPTMDPVLAGDFGKLMEWADAFRTIGVRTNADTPHDAKVAREFGAQGIGLCRTEHMFFEGDRIRAVREMILSEEESGRRKALAQIEPMQTEDFVGIFEAMEDLPVTIRLLDPPLHEFVPHEKEQQEAMARQMNVSVEKIREKVDQLSEFNPMLGHRGVRLGITFPEIYEMQARAILRAACLVQKKGKKVYPEIMIPLVGTKPEFDIMREMVDRVAQEIFATENVKVGYTVGTMIEIPRACLIADKIAEKAEFFSFGTNDLTQMTFGYSRDDAGKFLKEYVDKKILPRDPFQALDQEGVGEMVEIGIERGRKERPELKIGICGEHGGEPSSVEFCHRAGMNYVSCSPYRVPVARLAAAHAALKEKK
ncbi:MAG TPA: pyruvate, phosphate dikinase [Firmicutes bacterium]|nr:pyruvate, phosphate dikinase [Bacillota bacterium]